MQILEGQYARQMPYNNQYYQSRQYQHRPPEARKAFIKASGSGWSVVADECQPAEQIDPYANSDWQGGMSSRSADGRKKLPPVGVPGGLFLTTTHPMVHCFNVQARKCSFVNMYKAVAKCNKNMFDSKEHMGA